MDMNTSKIGLSDLDETLISFFEELASSGGTKLVQHRQIVAAETAGQTEFTIELETFDSENDSIMVQSGRTMLFPDTDFTISGNVITLKEGVSAGKTIGIYIWKNLKQVDEETFINGSQLADGSVPLSKLESMPEVNVTSDIPLHLSITADNELKITWGDDINKESTIV